MENHFYPIAGVQCSGIAYRATRLVNTEDIVITFRIFDMRNRNAQGQTNS